MLNAVQCSAVHHGEGMYDTCSYSKDIPVKSPSLLYSVFPCLMITTMGPDPSNSLIGFLLLAG